MWTWQTIRLLPSKIISLTKPKGGPWGRLFFDKLREQNRNKQQNVEDGGDFDKLREENRDKQQDNEDDVDFDKLREENRDKELAS